MPELPLARASRRLKLGLPAPSAEDGHPDERAFSQVDIKTIITDPPERPYDEVDDFLAFSRCFSFSGQDVKKLVSPLVYVLMRGNQALYVGMSTRGAMRPFRPDHHVLWRIRPTDKLLLWPVKNAAQAEQIERILIARLRPTHNKQYVTREALLENGGYLKPRVEEAAGG